MSARVQRHFATIGGRQVHYRRAGKGPPLLLLHEAPRCSAGFEPLMRDLANRFTTIAPDTPGNGYSEPLGVANPTMTDFASGLADLLDELGIPRCAVYGYHSGAQCALEFARSHPQRVARLVINGYLQLDEAFRQDIVANYFAPLSIDWSGSHLAWIWSRMREQWSFFPWYRRERAFRPPFEPPSPEALHESVIEMLQAGDAYRDSYRAAFMYDTARVVQELRVPTLITTPRDDVLFPGLAMMPKPAPCVRVEPSDTLTHAEQMLAAELASLGETLPDPPPPQTKPRTGTPWSSYAQAGDLQLHLRRAGSAAGRPWLVQHSAMESARCMDRMVAALARHAPALAIDLPGRGLSDDVPASIGSAVEFDAACIAAALQALGLSSTQCVGWRTGASVGLELARQQPKSVHALVALQPWWPLVAPDSATIARYAPPLEPDTAGTHLLRAWHMIRDQELHEPWFDRRLATVVTHHEPDLEPAVTQERLLALFRCEGSRLAHWTASLGYPWRQRLPQQLTRVTIGDALPALANAGLGLKAFPQNDFPALAEALQHTVASAP